MHSANKFIFLIIFWKLAYAYKATAKYEYYMIFKGYGSTDDRNQSLSENVNCFVGFKAIFTLFTKIARKLNKRRPQS